MANPTFELTEAERNELFDELVKIIARTPRMIGSEINWLQRAVDSILEDFELKGVSEPSGLDLNQISKLIETVVNSFSYVSAYDASKKVLAELKRFAGRKEQTAPEPTVIPTDETHNFGIMAKELIDSDGSMLTAGPVVTLTERQALAALAGLKNMSAVEFALIAQPKPQPWFVLDYRN